MVQHGLLAELEGLVAAHDWHGVVALKRETLALATALRGVDPSEAEFIHSTLGYGYQFLGQYREAKAVSEELRDRAGWRTRAATSGAASKRWGGSGRRPRSIFSTGRYRRSLGTAWG